MQQIKFNADLMEVITSGSKTATTRLGLKDKYIMGPVEFVDAGNAEHRLTGYFLNKAEYVPYEELTDELAWKEGYTTLDELQEALVGIYGEIEPEQMVTVLHWAKLTDFCMAGHK